MRTVFLAAVLVVTLAAVCLATPVYQRTYPLYKQCDPQWGNDLIVDETVCQVGCLMSSISMSLAGAQIDLPNGEHVDPGTLNTWLRNNGGYDTSDDLEEEELYKINPQRISYTGAIRSQSGLSMDQIVSMLQSSDQIVILNVRNGRHFVLATGFDDAEKDVIYINDPGFEVTQVSYSDPQLVGYRLFKYTS
jgi:hypothetical protein